MVRPADQHDEADSEAAWPSTLRLTIRIDRDRLPVTVRLRGLLKSLLRGYGMTCLRIEPLSQAAPELPAAEFVEH